MTPSQLYFEIFWFMYLALLSWWNCAQLKEINCTIVEIKKEINQMQIRDFPPIEDEPFLLSGPDYYDENSTTLH